MTDSIDLKSYDKLTLALEHAGAVLMAVYLNAEGEGVSELPKDHLVNCLGVVSNLIEDAKNAATTLRL